jgi:DGQHR domain-containing protein
MKAKNELRLPALAFRQWGGRVLYSVVCKGRRLPEFITISRIQRNGAAEVAGYQRPEVLKHIAEIREYLQTEAAMLPNALVVAFDERVRFESQGGTGADRHGELIVPVGDVPDHEKPGWVVDGQQRMAALREAGLDDFEVCVVAFIAESDSEQREQFILVNSTKPLPRGLIYELLPTTSCRLPSFFAARKFPAQLLERMNFDSDSPLCKRIKTPTNPDGVIKDNSVLRMIEHSLSDGGLFRYRDLRGGEHDIESMLSLLKTYWRAVADVFPEAWEQPPQQSRLTHGAGIVSMGYIMDTIADRHRAHALVPLELFRSDLELLRPACRWTDGFWEFGPGAQRRWNEIQNTSHDIQLLSNYLMIQYKALVWDRSLGAGGAVV